MDIKHVGKFIVIPINSIPKERLDVVNKRVQNEHLSLLELFDYYSLNLDLFFRGLNLLQGVNKILVDIKYPLDYLGHDSDNIIILEHKFAPFVFRVVKWNLFDYWKRASETVRDCYGDCEDTSILTHSFFIRNNVDSFCVFGIVYRNNKPLGGHAWVIAYLANSYRIVETTLDTLIPSFNVLPEVDLPNPPYTVRDIKYDPVIMLHNLDELWINTNYVHEMSLMYGIDLSSILLMSGYDVEKATMKHRDLIRNNFINYINSKTN